MNEHIKTLADAAYDGLTALAQTAATADEARATRARLNAERVIEAIAVLMNESWGDDAQKWFDDELEKAQRRGRKNAVA